MEEVPLNASIERMLKSRTWGQPLRALFSWLLQASQGEEDNEIELDVVKEALPDATEHLTQKSTNWLSFFRQLEKTGYGELILGRRRFKTRFRWEDDEPSQLARAALAFVGDNVASERFLASEASQSRDAAERVYPFPLRRNVTVYVRLPADVTREELARLADFTRLLPGL
jgi:hypothetical protein